MPEFCPICGHRCEEGALACIMCGAMPGDEPKKKLFGSGGPPPIDEYYRQARYATGQLFVGNVVTSLAVNTFFNPSLWELVHKMIKQHVEIVPLPREFEGRPYLDFFDKLIREDEVMPVAIYRRADIVTDNKKKATKGRKWSYIFTGPSAKETTMRRGDRAICFGSTFKFTEEDLEELQPEPIEAPEEEEKKAEAKPKAKRKPLPKLGAKPGASKGGAKNHGAMLMMR